MIYWLKGWIAYHYPYHRRCLRKWCWRSVAYDYRCYKHQRRF